jgi:LemA protein
MKKVILMVVGLVVFVLGIGLIGGCRTYNGLVASSQNVDQSWAQVQNVYQRRADLIPNLVNTVSGAANFEKTTLAEITQARASVGQVQVNPNQAPGNPADLQRFQQAQDGLSSALSRLLVVAERYPDLKANGNFMNLQAQLEGTENRITVERQKFNTAVQEYNTRVKTFPTVLFAALMGFQSKPYFTAQSGAEKVPTVNFDFGKSGTNK